jgi:hypothetical protein
MLQIMNIGIIDVAVIGGGLAAMHAVMERIFKLISYIHIISHKLCENH